jgi:Zn-dependent protease
MKHTWRLGRIFGVDINVDSSWIVIFILFTWVLAGSHFPRSHPTWQPSLNWMIGLLTSLLVFASVLAHELAHSLVAMKQGEKVRSITLFILGGVAQITEEPKKPQKEFFMALVGPMSSFALALLFFVLSLLLEGVSGPLTASASYLAVINLALGVFNLLPGFPMDGGRVLRSILWSLTGNLKKATRTASLVGQGFAFFLIVGGVWQILAGHIGGLWWILIGWFLHNAAVRGYSEVQIKSALQGMTAEDLMNKEFGTVPEGLPVRDLVDDYILKKKERVFLVVDNGSLKGIVCLDDIKKTPQDKWSQVIVRDIMTPRDRLEAVSPRADGNVVLSSLASRDIHQVPVMEGEKIVGIICRSDLLKYIQLRSELGV